MVRVAAVSWRRAMTLCRSFIRDRKTLRRAAARRRTPSQFLEVQHDRLVRTQQIRQDLSPLVYYAAARFPVADIYLSQFFHSRSIVKTPTAVTNFSHCAVADAEIDQARVETDPQKQLALWHAAQRKIIEQLCGVPLFETLLVFARHSSLDYGYELKGSMSLGPLITEATRFK